MFIFALLIAITSAAHASCGKKFNVPHQKKPSDYTGGPTSLAMAMNYYGHSYTGTDVCTYLGTCTTTAGTDFEQLLSAAQHYGFKDAAWKYGVSELQDAIASNSTTVAIINVEAGSYPKTSDGNAVYNSFSGGAYIEIHGVHCDSDGNVDYFVVNDPYQEGWKDLKYTYASMKSAWGARDYRFLALNKYSAANDDATNDDTTPDTNDDTSNTCTQKMSVAHQAQPTSYSCGPTSLAMAMNYYGYSYTGSQICNWIGNCYRTSGTDFEEKISAAHHYGFSNAHWEWGVSTFKSAIKKKVTTVAIIAVVAGSYPMRTNGEPAFYSFTGGHYIEIHGYHCDSNGNLDFYYCNDPAQSGWKDREYTYSSMKSAWGNRDYQFLALKNF